MVHEPNPPPKKPINRIPSSPPPNGGPAFPVVIEEIKQQHLRTNIIIHEGMTLRDYFAGQTIVVLTDKYGGSRRFKCIAEEAYKIADGMIEEKNNG